MKIDVAIIGAGHNALVAATYLARAGLHVEIFERRATLGGATLNEELWPGYTFSTGAHLLHAMPAQIVRELGLKAQGLVTVPRDEVIFLRRDGTYHTNLDFDLPNHLTARAKLSAAERDGLQRYEAFKQSLVGLVRPWLLRTPPGPAELERAAAGTPAAETLRLATTMRLWELHDHFLPTARLRERVVSEGSAFACNPGAFVLAYGAIDAADPATGEKGPWGFVRGGMGRLAAVLAEVARAAGVVIHTDSPIASIVVQNGRATGLQLESVDRIEARNVLSTADPKRTFLKLLGEADVEPALRTRIAGLNSHVSCCKFLAAIDELPQWRGWDGDPDLPHRGSVQLELNRDAITRCYAELAAGQPPARPMMSFNLPSMRDDSLAPAGRHTASVYVYSHPARLAAGTWDDCREAVAERLIDQITAYAPNFRRSVLHYELRTPLDLERKLALTDGCIWHLQHTPELLLGNRPLPELAHYRAPIAGLYLGGSGQHPGGEVSGIPGHNAAHEILKDLQLT